jgi:hypothetical protein
MKSWAEHSLALDSRCGRAYAALTLAAQFEDPPLDVERILTSGFKAASLSPHDALCQTVLGMAVYHASLALSETCARVSWWLDPFYLYAGNNVASTYGDEGRYVEQLSVTDTLLLLQPGMGVALGQRTFALAMLGRLDDAQSTMRQLETEVAAGRLDSVWVHYVGPLLAILSGDRAELDQVARDALALSANPNATWYDLQIAWGVPPLLVRNGRQAEALTILENISGRVPFDLFDNPDYAPLHDEPRFKAAVARARERTRALLPIFEQAEARGEIPDYLAPALADMRRKLGA